MSNGEWPLGRQRLRDQTSVAVLGVCLQAQKADRSTGLHELEHTLQAALSGCGAKMLAEYRSHHLVLAGAGCRPAVRWRPQRVDMDVGDPRPLQVGPESGLRETRATRARCRANVDDEIDAGAAELLE